MSARTSKAPPAVLRSGDVLVKAMGGATRRVLVTGVNRAAGTCTVRALSKYGGGGRVLLLSESGLPEGYRRDAGDEVAHG